MSQQPMKRYDPDLKYIGTGDYIPVMSPCNDGEYILAADVEAVLTDNARLRERLKDNVPIRFYRQDAHDIGEVMVQTHDGEFCRRTDLEAIQHALAAKEALLDSENVYHERLRQDLVEIINKVTSARDTLHAELAAVVEAINDKCAGWFATFQDEGVRGDMCADIVESFGKILATLPASARALLDEVGRLRERVKELEGNAIVAENRLIAAYKRNEELNHD